MKLTDRDALVLLDLYRTIKDINANLDIYYTLVGDNKRTYYFMYNNLSQYRTDYRVCPEISQLIIYNLRENSLDGPGMTFIPNFLPSQRELEANWCKYAPPVPKVKVKPEF